MDLSDDPTQLALDEPDLWEDLIRRVEDEDMPPPSSAAEDRRLEGPERASLIALLHELSRPPEPPRAATLRRLTRFEIERSIADVFGVQPNLTDVFPRDAAAYGFDTVGDVMFLTDLLVEKYFDLAQRTLDAVEASPVASQQLEGAPQEVLERILLRAFRRPATEQELAARLDLIEPRGSLAGGLRLRAALVSILVSPHFLFRVELDHGGASPEPLNAYELASRLSFTLWSQGPDLELLEAAATGDLLVPSTLEAQANRLLADPRSRALADGFASQWLRFRDMPEHAVDFRTYKGFQPALKRDLYEESATFFDALVREEHPITDLVTADWTYLNARLAKHYDLPPVQGEDLRRVAVDPTQRGGVLAQGSILTMTSHPTRTSPVLRGAWILDTLLDAPPPPPPADVTPLAASTKENPRTVRERLEAHRADPSCASCHARIDPLGFALESFDGVGRARAKDNGQPVNSIGNLPDGRAIEGLAGLKQHLGQDPEALARSFVRRLFVYAIGRPPERWDVPAVDEVLERAARSGWSTKELILGLVLSEPFRTRGIRSNEGR